MKLADRPLSRLTGSIPCSCGRQHVLATSKAGVYEDAPAKLGEALEAEGAAGRVLLLCDRNTYDVLGAKAEAALRQRGRVDVCALRGDDLHADEEALGAALMACREDTARVVAVGSGTVGDIARFLASRLGRPYDVLGTAPSMDGYVSTVSPLLRRGFKTTFEAVAPRHALLDLPAMCAAPQPMIAAGLGDVMGKTTALADWALARDVYGEYYCQETAQLMRKAVSTCAASADGLAAREPDAVAKLAEGLLLSGIAMQLVGNSRPASGAEHHLAHFWEMRQLTRGEKPTLHGDKVGYAVLLVLDYYRLFFEKKRLAGQNDVDAWTRGIRAAFGPIADEVIASGAPDGVPNATVIAQAEAHWDALRAIADEIAPLRAGIASMVRNSGGPTTAQELNLSREDVLDALLYSKEIRPRPTVMRLGFAWGAHEEICREIVEELFHDEA